MNHALKKNLAIEAVKPALRYSVAIRQTVAEKSSQSHTSAVLYMFCHFRRKSFSRQGLAHISPKVKGDTKYSILAIDILGLSPDISKVEKEKHLFLFKLK